MKTDRSASVITRAAAVLLAGLLFFVAGAEGRRKPGVKVISMGLAAALVQQIGEVQQRFDASRRALRTVPGPGGVPAYPLQEVAGLIDRTGKDLDQAIEQVGEPGLDGLRAWSDEELRRIQNELEAPPARTAVSLRGLSTPRAVAVTASLGGGLNAAAPQQETITAERSNRILDQVGAVISRIFFLAEKDDLEVKLWVGSTPAQRATFRFWPQGQVKGPPAAPLIIRTNDQKGPVFRGLYTYQAAWAKGAVTRLIEYPSPAPASERLDLVNNTSFFCCRFNEQYCHHVDDEKECQGGAS